jgi:hypothetical protein
LPLLALLYRNTTVYILYLCTKYNKPLQDSTKKDLKYRLIKMYTRPDVVMHAEAALRSIKNLILKNVLEHKECKNHVYTMYTN